MASAPLLRPSRIGAWRLARLFGVPDFDVLEPSAFSRHSEFYFGFRRVPNTVGLQKGCDFAINGNTHFVSDCFDAEQVSFTSFKLGRISDAVRGDNLVDFALIGSHVFFEFHDTAALRAFTLVENSHAVQLRLRPRNVPVVRTRELAVVKLHVDHCGAVKADLCFNNAVFGGQL